MSKTCYARFLIVWSGQLVSGIGSGMTAFALAVYVFEQTGSNVSFSMVMVSLFVPAILTAPLGGVLADRFDRRIMIILGDAGSAAAVVFLLTCLISGSLSIRSIYWGVAFASAFSALQGPAYKASLSDLLSAAQFAKAGGLVQLASSARYLLAPIAAGYLISVSGIKGVLMMDLISFAFAVTAALCLPKREKKRLHKKKSFLCAEMKEGWQSLALFPGVRPVVAKLAVVTLFAGYVQTLFTPMMLAITDVKTLGTIQSISALGMLAGSLLISILGLRRNLPLQLSLGLGSGGLFLSAMGISTNPVLIAVFLFLFFICLPFINTSAEVLIRSEIPNHKQGRIWGIIGFLSQTGYIAAYMSAGYLSDKVFTPMLQKDMLAKTIGQIIGTGPGRGNALILMICGLGLIFTAFTGEKQCCFLRLSKKI